MSRSSRSHVAHPLPRVSGIPARCFASVWQRLKDFAGFGGEATYLWPRWIVLRGVGLIYVVIFAGIIDEAAALIGPDGLAPLPAMMAQLRETYPSFASALLHAPTLFWVSTHPWMPVILAWSGLLAAVALVLNLWPRMSLFVCWLALLSFARGWLVFSEPLLDWLMLEVALLCLFFAPKGWRPGLGADSSPRPLVVFTMRWLLFRIMMETGLSKIFSGEERWRNLTAMDFFYETAPCPTILAYLDHQLPHAWHVVEVVLTFAAEIGAPLVAAFGGRRGRWAAFLCWSVFQVGIQLTANFGWLNVASFTLGFLFLDDQMLAAVARRLPWRRRSAVIASAALRPARVPMLSAWQRSALGLVLWTHFAFSFLVFWPPSTLPLTATVEAVINPVKNVLKGLGAVNKYTLYSRLDPFHFVAEFVGSNDGGVTWRTYEYRYFPQALDRMSPFIAPRFPRFEATLQIQGITQQEPAMIYASVATRLLEQNPHVLALFKANPFPDRPPQMIRTPGYHYTLTDYAAYRENGHFWKRVYVGEYIPMFYVNEHGQIARSSSALEQLRISAHYGNPASQAHLGFLSLVGEEGVAKDGAAAARWLRLASEQGVADAQLNLALVLAAGDGVPVDLDGARQWCRRAAEQGLVEAQDRLGMLYLQGGAGRRNEREALVWFQVAALSGHAGASDHRRIAISRMAPDVVEEALRTGERLFATIAEHAKKSQVNP